MADTIDFQKIAAKTGDQRTSFEELYCQVARNGDYNVSEGSTPVRIHGEGGDGGVEFYWKLPDDSEWGWQAKFLFDFDKLKTQARKSFKTAIVLHPKLKKYFIGIPFNLTDDTAKGKGQQKRYQEFKQELEQLAAQQGVQVEVILEPKSEILDKLIAIDPAGGRIRFWFEEKTFSKDWIIDYVVKTVSAIPRYTPQLKVGTTISNQLMAFTHADNWQGELKSVYKELKDKAYYWSSAVTTKDDKGWGAKFPEDLIPRGQESVKKVAEIQKVVEDILIREIVPADSQSGISLIDDCLKHLRELTADIKQELVEQYGPDKVGSANYRQFEAEYMVSFPMANYDTAVELDKILSEVKDWLKKGFIEIYNAKCLLITGEWGVGKTFAICDLAEIRRKKGQPTVLLFGDRFLNTSEVWIGIQNQLGLQFESKDQLFSMLQASAEMHDSDLIICIDAVNETVPRNYWHSRMRSLLADIQPYNNLRLCISCRASYKEQVIEELPECIELVHPGFKGVEHEAASKFFSFYGLIPPSIPIIHPEFANPLFLRLVCQTLQSFGLKQIPNGWQGISTIIQAFLEEKSKALMSKHGIDKRYHIPEKALQKFVAEAKRLKKSLLSWDEANAAVNSALKEAGIENSIQQPLLQWLIDEHLLFLDAGTNGAGEYVRISFERLGDHLLAASLINDCKPENLQREFSEGGNLYYLLSDEQALFENKGVLEALSIQLPEKCSVELTSLANQDIFDQILKISIGQLHWRDPSHFSQQTINLINRGLRNRHSHLVFDELLMCAFVSSELDANLLDNLLRRKTMIERDPFWCGYLHSRFGSEKSIIKDILEFSLREELVDIPEDILERWCILVCWFLAAADRRVRDKATKALVNLTEKQPQVWVVLLQRFIDIDDEYILERVLACAYGTLLRIRNKELEKEIAIFVNERIFAQPVAMLNAAIRDHARSIIELALQDEAIKPKDLKNPYLPPYKSDSKDMLRVPSDAEVEEAKKNTDKTKLESSCFFDDFFNYTLGSVRQYDHFMNKKDMAKWVFVHVANMGYNTEDFVNYEGYMMYTYGGGRGKPVWAERIGKKYQWIALFRLAGIFTDNVEAEKDNWDPEPLTTPLMFERGRQIDPSILCKEPQTQAFYEDDLNDLYDYRLYEELSDEQWIKLKGNLPPFEGIQQELGGEETFLLDGHMERSDQGEFDDSNKKHRRFWVIINSYLVKKEDVDKAWEWLSKKNFMGKWMPEGASYNDGFVGEYPWGTLFNIYEDYYLSYGRNPENEEFPCLFIPTSATLHSNDEYDSSEMANFTVVVPTRIFFEKDKLTWNNIDGYKLGEKLVLFDPSIRAKRKGALLADKEYLMRFLKDNGYVLIWTVLAEKMVAGIDNSFIRQTFNQIHKLNEDGTISSSKPVIEIK